jgi:hypothetical protein
MPETVTIGARMRRAGQRWKTYRVVSIRSPAHHQPHVQLVAETRDAETVTVSVATLIDGRYWQPVA